jgi:hypothetical protein
MNTPVTVPIAALLVGWPALYISAAATRVSAKTTDWMIAYSGAPALQKPVSAFNRSTLQFRWIVSVAGNGSFRVVADTFQMLTTTLVLMEFKFELGANLKTRSVYPVEVFQKIALPESDEPLRLLVKPGQERGAIARCSR